MTSGTLPLLSPGGMSLMTRYHARRVTMSSTPLAQPRRTNGLQGLRVELTERVTKWCLLSANCDVQSSSWSCEDHSRGMAGLCPEDSGTPGRQPELNTLWYSQPVEFAKQWCNRLPHHRLKDKSRCGVTNGLQTGRETTGDTGEHGVAIVDPANH